MAAKLVKNFEFGKPANPNDIPDLDTYRRAFMIGPARYKTRIICKNWFHLKSPFRRDLMYCIETKIVGPQNC